MLNRPSGAAVVLISLVAFLSSCGGSGGGAITSTPLPPPLAAPNEPPVVRYSISTETLNEGETFLIDARASSDPDGEIVSINAVHDFHPGFPELEANPVNIGNHPTGVFEFLVPEVFGDTQALFNITVEDNRGVSTTEIAFLTFRSTVNTPKIDGFGEPYRIFDTGRPMQLLGGNFDDLFAVEIGAFTNFGGQEIIALTDKNSVTMRNNLETDTMVVGEVQVVDKFIPDALTFNLQPGTPIQFAVMDEAGNAFHWFADYDLAYPDIFELKQTMNIEKPCYLAQRASTEQDFVWIGQRGAGLSVVQLERNVPSDLQPGTPNSQWARGFRDSIKSRAGGSRSLCYLFPTVLPERLSSRFPQFALSDLIAVDYDSNELVLLANDAGDDEVYETVGIVALETGGVQNMKIVDVRGVGSPSQVPRFLLVVMSDGFDNGQHRLIVIEQETFSSEISQTVYPWEGGVPLKMVTPGSLFGAEGKAIDYGVDLVIISSTSSQAVIFEDERADLGLGLGLPIYKLPQYLDIGPGAGSIVAASGMFQGLFTGQVMFVSYPETNELKLWVYRD